MINTRETIQIFKMDAISKLMNARKPFAKVSIRSGQVEKFESFQNSRKERCEEFLDSQSDKYSYDYAEEYQRKEEALYSELSKFPVMEDEETISLVEGGTDLLSFNTKAIVENLEHDQICETFQKYNFNKYHMQSLPIDIYREKITSVINTNDTVILEGATGCGKTTQVPQFILDDCKAKHKPCKIVVTQPRRIAAISVARRVCEERSWGIGSVCGYQVGLESTVTRETLLAYVTTGVLLQRLIKQKNLHEYTHIIVDEVHERDQDMDFLLLIIRKFLNTNSSNTKVILMSATFNTEEFSRYFKLYIRDNFIPAPVIKIETLKPRYDTQYFYLDHLKEIGMTPACDINHPKIEPQTLSLFVLLIRALERLDEYEPMSKKKKIGHVLVFLPGIVEIDNACEQLERYREKKSLEMVVEWQIFALHSSVTVEEQRKAFDAPKAGCRKVILSTNIAESSITVPDISYVVDFCLTKTLIVDSETQYQSLQLQWASHVNCTQRAGRVGRVSEGRVYRLVLQDFYENSLPSSIEPEILRAPISQIVLKTKLLDLNQSPKAILALAMNPPALNKIDNSILYLKEVGALTLLFHSKKSSKDGNITFLGEVMAGLPLDIHLSKLILLGHMFGCLEECVIMATGCSLNIFKSPFRERHQAYINRLQWADGSSSDLIAHLNLFKVWQTKRRLGNKKTEADFCKQNFVGQRSLREWAVLVEEVKGRLSTQFKVRPSEGPKRVILNNIQLPTVIKIVICGALYPNYFVRNVTLDQDYEREAVKILGGRDPFETIYFTGFDPQQPGPLYAGFIKKQLDNCSPQMEVTFDRSSKVYVTFKSPHQKELIAMDGKEYSTGIPGNIKIEVYRAIKLRQLRMDVIIPILSKQEANELAKEKGLKDLNRLPVDNVEVVDIPQEEFSHTDHPVLPPLDVQNIYIQVCQTVECGHFWAYNVDTATKHTLIDLQEILNSQKMEKIESNAVRIGGLYAAQFSDDGYYYRCKVLAKNIFGRHQSHYAQIIFIDYGTTQTVSLDEFYTLPNNEIMSVPGQAMECCLSEIQPSAVLNPRALWSEKATAVFNAQIENQSFYAKVYSVVHDVVHLELYRRKVQPIFENSLNYWLISQGYAQAAEESFLSKENNQKRQQLLQDPQKLTAFLQEETLAKANEQDIEPPDTKNCTGELRLKGPYSPLEMKLYSVVGSGCSKTITVETNSVNSVLLDPHPQDLHDRLIVAAHISQNTTGSGLSLRHTTVMPNIHGFPMLMSLLFCPVVEMKPVQSGTRFGAILCGLGAYDDSNNPIYSLHDISLILDTKLTHDDINKVNALRYWMNVAVQAMKNAYENTPPQVELDICQNEIKDRLFKLLRQSRESVERVYLEHANEWGKCLYYSELLKPGDYVLTTEIWPLHSTMQLTMETKNQDATENTNIEKHLNDLEEIALNMKKPTSNMIKCNLCSQETTSAIEMRMHIATERHRENVKRFKTNASK